MNIRFKKCLSMLLAIIMVVGMVPASIFTAFAAETTIRLKDGSISVYDLFVTYGGAQLSDVISSFRYVDANNNNNTSKSYNITGLTGNVSLSNGTYKIQKKGIIGDWKDTGNSITVQVYHELIVDVTNDPIPEGAGVKINGTYYADGAIV